MSKIISDNSILANNLELYNCTVSQRELACNFDDSRINGDAINTRDLKFQTSCVYIYISYSFVPRENSVIKFLRLTS